MQDNIINDNNKTMSSSSSAASGQPTKVSELRNLSGSATKRLYYSMPIIALTSGENITVKWATEIEIQLTSSLTDRQV